MSDMNLFEPLVKEFNGYLEKRIEDLYPSDSDLHGAAKYALMAGGKRVRPILALLVHRCCGGQLQNVWPAALALEMIHTYSLVHDDLPCMDNDDFRRGKPTAHKVYSEAIALLAGDALLTDAFKVLGEVKADTEAVLEAMISLSKACGGQGMVYGQDQDMYWTGKQGYGQEHLYDIHKNKTGKLIAASCCLGSLLSPHKEFTENFNLFGEKLGLAFQIIDDLLDESTATGKSVGKDKAQGKLTFLSLMSYQDASGLAHQISKEAFHILKDIPLDTQELETFTQALLKRDS